MAKLHTFIFFAILEMLYLQVTAQSLKSYDVDGNSITASGISAGGAMAIQMHVAYSSTIKGVGSVAGISYMCAQSSVSIALGPCMANPGAVDVNELIDLTTGYNDNGEIDPTSNLANSKVFILHGTNDGTVDPGASDIIREFYDYYGADIAENRDLNMGHGFPTIDYGTLCTATLSPYINRCDHNGAYEVLNYLYGGNLIEPTGNVQLAGELLEYDQLEFIEWPPFHSLNDIGWIYVPAGCAETHKQNTKPRKNTPQPAAASCDVVAGNRHDCGWFGIDSNKCLERGCCFDSTSNPSCFCSTVSDFCAKQCHVTSNRTDCGFPGITEAQCLTTPGCCYQETPPAYCYFSPAAKCEIATGDRTECGFSGIDETECNRRGCCWKTELPFYCYNSMNTPAPSTPKPSSAPSGKCKLHVSLHGCVQSPYHIDDEYVRYAGYLEVAELNDIVVLFPQAKPGFTTGNPNACFDWWGYDDGLDNSIGVVTKYGTQTGPQMRAIKSMIDRVVGI